MIMKKKVKGNKYKFQKTSDMTDEEVNEFADEMVDWYRIPEEDNAKLWLGEYAVKRTFPRRALKEMAERTDYFKAAYEQCMSLQETRIVCGGLEGKLNSIIVKAALAEQHGWKDSEGGAAAGVVMNITVEDKERLVEIAGVLRKMNEEIGMGRVQSGEVVTVGVSE